LADNLAAEINDLSTKKAINTQNKYFWEDELIKMASTYKSDLGLISAHNILITASISDNYIDFENEIAKLTRNGLNLQKEENAYFDIIGKRVLFRSIFDGKNTRIGLLAVPFYNSSSLESTETNQIFQSILSTFALIFIAFLVLSILISENLTRPLKLITQYIKSTDLQHSNQPISWKSNDEIGQLVEGYNAMLGKIEVGKSEITQHEKQAAWQDIAKQVAHEIKNPLTPMKLNLQHLQNTIKKGVESKELLNKNIKNLLYNIENISEIVDSFMAFAKMPMPKIEKINFLNPIKAAYQNFINNDSVSLKIESKLLKANVLADEKLLFQIINNLIINALQSVGEGVLPKVEIEFKKSESKYILSIADNGMGISDEFKTRIFLPNFSTKNEGTGIGLSLAKWGIENMNGEIWFENKPKNGTIFFIELAKL
jgi:two-component system, NtrC family, nitrogen regulation sensor histidine kinase NtrY